ncbi:TolB protein [Pullulanibacillus pueri]|uniref:WD40 repeat protein n=1 Tax=Pullulanibacillus pueri TaxID=1437324 RepID=A0A8J3ENT7_9BACL|nr:DUF5711 family protein [Pullulanibacillus pueri]MBM7683680.1 TolB protein [Pullulanibacillus pueri]GGH87135.1 hypothetical protein GCM10007096_36450 [Pullulanibacillus pueri]
MNKPLMYSAFLGFLVVLLVLIALGFRFNKTEEEKQVAFSATNLAEAFTVSENGTIAYLTHGGGKSTLHFYNPNSNLTDPKLTFSSEITDLTFSQDGSKLAYVSVEEMTNKKQRSIVRLYDLNSKKDTQLFSDPRIVREVAFSPDAHTLFFLGGSSFTHYSPITGDRPHDYDLYQYTIQTKKLRQVTHQKAYEMDSLVVSGDGKSVYVEMSEEANTPEEIFAAKQRIFRLPLDNPEQKEKIPVPSAQGDIYDFAIAPSEQTFIYQSTHGEKNGVYNYELFRFNKSTGMNEVLTHLYEYAEHPVISAGGKKIYFMVDKQFARKYREYHLYVMHSDGSKVREITLPAVTYK